MKRFVASVWAAMACGLVASQARAQILNGSFETWSGNPAVLADNWVNFNNTFIETSGPYVRTGAWAIKTFGNFNGGFNVSGIFQDLPASPGQVWEAGAYAYNCSCDAMRGTNNFAVVNIEFRDNPDGANFPPIQFFSSPQINTSTPQDQFILHEVTGTAPPGTTIARVVLLFVQPAGFDGGSVFWDDAFMNLLPPACVADFDDGSGTGTPDGGVTIDDLIYYLALFDLGDVSADVDDGSGTGTQDQGVTIDDLLYFLVRFDAGC